MKKIVYTMLCASVSVACMQETLEVKVVPSDVDKVYASIENVTSKVQLNSEKKTVWTAEDTIFVIRPDKASYYLFDGETGDREGGFSWLMDETWNDSRDGAPSDYGFNEHYAVYSFRSVAGIGSDGTNPLIYATATPEQKYLEGSYGLHANLMFGTSKDGGNTFTFKNLFSYLRISLTGSRTVRRIQLSENNYGNISGTFCFTPDAPEDFYIAGDTYSYIILDCGEEGVRLTDEPVDFYFSLPPFTASAGIGIFVEFTDGSNFHQRTSNEITFKRNTIHPMATLSTDNEEWNYVRISHHGTRFNTPWVYGKSSLSGYLYFGDDEWIVLDQYSYTYDYNDGKDGHDVTIKVRDVDKIWFNGCKGITKIDFSEF